MAQDESTLPIDSVAVNAAVAKFFEGQPIAAPQWGKGALTRAIDASNRGIRAFGDAQRRLLALYKAELEKKEREQK